MKPVEIALVDTTGKVHPHTMSAAAAAFNIQVSQHLRQYWGFAPQVTVRWFPIPADSPQRMADQTRRQVEVQ